MSEILLAALTLFSSILPVIFVKTFCAYELFEGCGYSYMLWNLITIIKLQSLLFYIIETREMDIQPDSYRYINWLLFFLAASINSVPTQAFSGIAPIISRVYDIGEPITNIQTLIYPCSYLFLLLPANYIIDQKGLKKGSLFCKYGYI